MKRFEASHGPRIVGPRDGTLLELGAIGVRFMVSGEESGGGFSLVERSRVQATQPVAHVLEAGDTLSRVLEIISPAGFEHYFDEVAEAARSRDELAERYGLEVDVDRVPRLCEEHGLRFPPMT